MKNFEALGVDANIIKGLKELKIFEPSAIQSEVIPILLSSNTDLVGQAQTGTGKTAAYGIPLLSKIDPSRKAVQGLVLCPTRELSLQVAKQLFKFTKYTDIIFTEAVYGGEHMDIQIKALSRTTHIIVATPGRLLDLIKRKIVDLTFVRTVILDEADEMLSMGFKRELDQILSTVAKVKNKWLFSATLPKDIQAMVNQHMSPNAYRVQVGGKQIVNENIEHQFIICDEYDKFSNLIQFLNTQKGKRGMVFCKTKTATKELLGQLQKKGISCDTLHGDLLQKERQKVMRAFKNENLQILVATDIAARGLDVNDLAFVVHYQLPDKEEYYTHRSGRTARAGKKGISFVIASPKEMQSLKVFQTSLKLELKHVKHIAKE